MKRPRPALVTWLSLGVLTLAIITLGGFVAGLSLPELPFTVPSGYLLIRNGIWGGWALAAAIGAFFGMGWAPNWIRWGSVITLAWFWADRLFLAGIESARSGLPLLAATSGLVVAAAWFILSRRSVRNFFGEMDS